MSFDAIVSALDSVVPDDPAAQAAVFARVAEAARAMWETDPDSAYFGALAQKVGDAARVESSRIPLGESGLLHLFCQIIATPGLEVPLIVQSLRIVGNTCADEDVNREKVVASGCLLAIIDLLSQNDILAFVIPVLYNICVDYEPAQKAIYQAGINPKLIALISGPRLDQAAAFMNYICKLLGFVAALEPEPHLVDPATPLVLLGLAGTSPLPLDAEDFLGQTSAALPYLSLDQFQSTFLQASDSIYLLLQTFERACRFFEDAELDPDEQAQLKKVRTAFVGALSDISAHPAFAARCTPQSGAAQLLRRWVSTPSVPLATGACQTLGNIARSDETCIYLVAQAQIHIPLIAILADPTNVDAGYLHSVLGFLKNLAIPPGNKVVIGDAGALELHVLPRLWDLDAQPQVQFDAVSLARLLVLGCPENVRRVCAPLCQDPSSPAHDRSRLHILMELIKRSDNQPTQLESARAITAVCRALHTTRITGQPPAGGGGGGGPSSSSSRNQVAIAQQPTPTPSSSSVSASAIPIGPRLPSPPRVEILPFFDSAETPLQRFYANHHEITGAMMYLGTQTQFPVLRSELLFVFALMARTHEGAMMVARSMARFEFVGVLVEIVTGEKVLPARLDEVAIDVDEQQGDSPGTIANNVTDLVDPASPSDASTNNNNNTNTTTVSDQRQVAPPQTKPKSMQDVDRENALVLIAELLQRCPYELLPLPRRMFDRLLRGGGQQLLRERMGTQPSSSATAQVPTPSTAP